MTTKPLVSGKGLSGRRCGFRAARARRAAAGLLLLVNFTAVSADLSAPRFLGSQSCASSMCHGGAGDRHDEFVTWSKKDFHTRAPATLTMARSERMAETLKIGNPATDAQCTVCHNPMAALPPARKAAAVRALEAVSCETCHNAAEPWILTHTRTDISYVDKVNAGMRDLKNLHVRANTCVACHQNLAPAIRAAGHPELIFEMDGQGATMPRHWNETNRLRRAQAWLVGQLVALREATAQAATEPTHETRTRAAALEWFLARVLDEPAEPGAVARESDRRAREMAAAAWQEGDALRVLERLASLHESFAQRDVPMDQLAMRAERVVLGLDRLTAALGLKAGSRAHVALDDLFKETQSRPDFSGERFAQQLRGFADELKRAELKHASTSR